jgi:hypothetical protein
MSEKAGMRPPKTVAAAWIGLLALCLCGTADVAADPILNVIDIRAILARHDIGNALGLAFNPELNVIYLRTGRIPAEASSTPWMPGAVFSASSISRARTNPAPSRIP